MILNLKKISGFYKNMSALEGLFSLLTNLISVNTIIFISKVDCLQIITSINLCIRDVFAKFARVKVINFHNLRYLTELPYIKRFVDMAQPRASLRDKQYG